MSSPISAMITWAAWREMPGISPSRAIAGGTGALLSWPASGPVLPSVFTP
jgi:hypothetical protein